MRRTSRSNIASSMCSIPRCASTRAKYSRRCAAAPSRAASTSTWARSVSRICRDSERMNTGAESARLVPRDAADVAAIVAGAERPLEPVGGGSKRQIGKPVEAQLLDLNALTGIVAYEPAELVLTARAATPLVAIEQALGAHSQRLAFEPPDFARLLGEERAQTIGGVLAANLAGSRRVTAGAARDHFLGCQAVSGRGEAFKAGGRVVKNVTGYDLPKLLAGAYGTLALLTEVTLKVLPAPADTRTVLIRGLDDATAIRVMALALQSPYEVAGAAHVPAGLAGGVGVEELGSGTAATAIRLEG